MTDTWIFLHYMREFCVKAEILTVEELDKLGEFLLHPPRNRYCRFQFGRITGVELDTSRYTLTLYMTDGVDYFHVIIWMRSYKCFLFDGEECTKYIFVYCLDDSGFDPICQWQIVKTELELEQLSMAVNI